MIKRYGVEGGKGTGGQALPFAKAVEAGGWLYVSGQTPMVDGEIIDGGIIAQSTQAIQNCLDIMTEAGFGKEDIVHMKVFLSDARYFQSFNKVFKGFFAEHPPARVCCVADLVVDCMVEVDMTCYRADRR
ncbi:reactive intermediate/imine deaminase [Leminorella grimontii]|uniref:Reactive intermediate/imine deaminase n=1 Tax=Leminorella grimontii TaxID=82981 RepID=A0AAV5N4U6_9GAMM|nr:RidA family protein [Leminorella grimontii]KFC93582.1 endoribonuclease L-PSP [Leminorella grimontii ATCC 33999 = DSM 5078]GKX55722.1 reactive intermediate/imine deaminase [Leminorella grimontii]GKX59531.1 reactive intermediate/imine deaminase [Leminorella grimontii]VFS55290.1 Enamine/imine deaminase [Leminorella grimontii]